MLTSIFISRIHTILNMTTLFLLSFGQELEQEKRYLGVILQVSIFRGVNGKNPIDVLILPSDIGL
jgi:hypothetical protein